MGKIFVEGLALEARVGVYKRERGRRQPLSLDLEVDFGRVEQAAQSERLADTLNYEQMVRLAQEVIERRHYPLVETLATTLARELLASHGVLSARVRLRKIGCMDGVDCAGTEVTLEHEEDTSGDGAGFVAEAPLTSTTQRNGDGHPRALPLAEVSAREEIVIVGGGVAGMAAALWCGRLGHPCVLVDPGPRLGGQLHMVHFEMIDVPGFARISGVELIRRMWRQVPATTRWVAARLEGLEASAGGHTLTLRGKHELKLEARTLILATGLSRRTLAVPGERELRGRGILSTGSRDIDKTRGQRVAIIGGGDGACENALKLADVGAEPVLLHRGAQLSARQEFVEAVAEGGIEVRLGAKVTHFHAGGDGHLESIELGDGERLPCRYALVRVGWLPNSEIYPSSWLDTEGYVPCDADLRVKGEERVFVVGDLRNPPAPSVAASCGDGANAAKAAVELLEGRGQAQS